MHTGYTQPARREQFWHEGARQDGYETYEQQHLHTHTHTSWIQISPHLSTVYQAFVLQHVIVHQTHAPELMCLCFVNLKAAYDKVQWPLIWQVLQRLGIHGTCSVDCLTQFTQTAP